MLAILILVLEPTGDGPGPAPVRPTNRPPVRRGRRSGLALRRPTRPGPKYNGMMARPPENASAHWKMAVWCEQNGLRPEAYFHFGKVIELDPKRDAAWQKLGFKKVAGRWMTTQQIAAEAAQKKADKEWSVKFKKWHKEIHGGKKQAEARAGLEGATDPAAVPSIYREFCGGSGADQEIALQMLGQVEGPIVSKVLVVMAIYGKTARRPSPRHRVAPEPPFRRVPRHAGRLHEGPAQVRGPSRRRPRIARNPLRRGGTLQRSQPVLRAAPGPILQLPGPATRSVTTTTAFPMIVLRSSTNTVAILGPQGRRPRLEVPRHRTRSDDDHYRDFLLRGGHGLEAQRSAMSASRLSSPPTSPGSTRSTRTTARFNELVMTAAQAATGKNPGRTAKEWRDMLAQGKDERYARRSRTVIKPTVDEMVPLAYVPDLSATITIQSQTRFITQTIVDT